MNATLMRNYTDKQVMEDIVPTVWITVVVSIVNSVYLTTTLTLPPVAVLHAIVMKQVS